MLTLLKKNKHDCACHQAGLTLIELMTVVSILGIITALSLTSYQTWIGNSHIRNVADSIQTGLQKTRVEALKHNAPVQFVLNANSAWSIGCVVVVNDLDADGIDDCPATIEQRASKDGASANINVTATPADATTVVFNSLGQVLTVPTVLTAPFTQVDIVSTAANSRVLRVTIGAGGISRTCDPFPGLPASDPRKC